MLDLGFVLLKSTLSAGERLGESGVVSLYDFNSLPRSGEAQPVRTLKVIPASVVLGWAL